jgi:hypothetical protein
MKDQTPPRRSFLRRGLGFAGLAAAMSPAVQAQQGRNGDAGHPYLPNYARQQNYKSLKQSSHDVTGGNHDSWPIAVGATQEVFRADGPGAITHIWFTIASPTTYHLKELVLRGYWDGNSKPSIEAPVGDFFGLNLGQYQIYESAYLACSPGKSLNSYFVMPYHKSARFTVTNESKAEVRAFYSNIDYMTVPSLPADTHYFHAQYRQATPNVAANHANKLNPDGKSNYVDAETRGRGHLMGVTLGVQINADGWMGEGDDMIFIDDESAPLIIGTGMEDYFLGSWNFGGREGAVPFAHHYYGAPIILMPERAGGRYNLYRWHGDNPVTFDRYMKHTSEHGHDNDRVDNYYSVCYWYQSQPYTDFPALPAVETRLPRTHFPA